jgi:hypothetical protein
MKTKNNVQKTILKSTAIAVIFGLISLTVNAQLLINTVFDNLQHNDLIAMSNNYDELSFKTSNTSSLNDAFYANYLTTEKEESLKIENWMTDENFFEATIVVSPETESPLQMEDWMIDETTFTATNAVIEESESPMELENWMTNENFFEATMVISPETESPLQMEDWMMDETTFTAANAVIEESENPMQLENWMTNENLFRIPDMSLTVETESALELENWMINDDVFNVEPKTELKKTIQTSYFYYSEANEYNLSLEKWMVNTSTWRK